MEPGHFCRGKIDFICVSRYTASEIIRIEITDFP